MLDTLRRIVQEVSDAPDLNRALSIIVKRVKETMGADACSVYLDDVPNFQFVLMATDGLNPDAVGHVRLNKGEGLVSVVSEIAEPLNLADAHAHPRYRYVVETGELQFHGFLGVPIIHRRQILGVLVVRQSVSRCFEEEEVSFLFTVAAQLAGAIAHAKASGGVDTTAEEHAVDGLSVIGLPGAPGVALGTAVVVYPPTEIDAIPDRAVTDAEAEVRAFGEAVDAVRVDLRALQERVASMVDSGDKSLFDAYLLMLNSTTLVNKTIERIRGGNWAAGALRDTVKEYVRVFDALDDPYMRERAGDVRDLGRRVLTALQAAGRSARSSYPEHTILVGEEITATMLAEVPVGQLAGVVSRRGSTLSHVAILAHAMGIPAVVGAGDLPTARLDGRELVVDGYQGRVYPSPSPAIRAEYARLASEEAKLTAGLEELRTEPSITPDGVHVPLYANTGLLSDMIPSLDSGAEGVGLYRTEFPFMIRDRFPGEEEQRRIYRRILETFAPRPVVLRTLDVGGDKALPYFPISEDNPFLGWRGIRITLDHPEIFLVQLRAMLRASAGLQNMHLLFPMVSGGGEVDEAIRLMTQAYKELVDAREAIVRPGIGVMVEVPSAVYQTAALARRVDFFSVGSNDLTQYMLAVDRNNARVADLYDSLHPAVLQAIADVVVGAHRHNKPVSVCGEMAGDPAAALLLLGMGVDSLSMSVASLPRVKWVVRNVTRRDAAQVLKDVLALEDPVAIRRHVEQILRDAGLGGLVRAAP